jgi:two-component system, OmpR family, phosphate regulon sensor histidine kinase PhoR
VWTSKLFWKLFFIYTGIMVLLAMGFSWLLATHFEQQATNAVGVQLEKLGTTLITQAASSPEEILPALAKRLQNRDWLREQNATILNVDGSTLAGQSLPVLLSPADLQAVLSGATKQAHRRLPDGVSQVITALPIRRGEEMAGILVLSQSLPELRMGVRTAQYKLWLGTLALTLLAVLATYGLLLSASRRLTQLTTGAQAIAERDEPTLLPLESLDELGLLGDALNKMQQKLARRMDELHENSDRLETMLGSMLEGVLAVSPQNDVLLANNASCKLLGITIEQPLGRSLMDVTRSIPLHAAVVEAWQTNAAVSKEFESSTLPRRTLAVRAMRMPGTPSPGIMVVLHDISELRRLENLRQEFVANVSHELKTPLSAIKAYAETLKMGALHDPEHGMAFVERIEEQAERLHELILDLLHLARVESGQEAFEIVDVELSEAVLDCVDQFSELAASKHIELQAIGPNDSVVVRGDEEGVRTILSNLINNAVKYTPEHGRVTVRWRMEQGFGVVEVEDTGIGIAMKDQARVFQRFYRVDRARSREMGGTGLGLAIVKHLTHAFGGTVGLESQPKKGSLFWVRLPCAKS